MNPENRGYYLRNRPAEPQQENRGTVLNREELLPVGEQLVVTPLQLAEPTIEVQPPTQPPPEPAIEVQPPPEPPIEDQPPTLPPPVEPVDPSVEPTPTMMMQPTGLQLEKFAGDDSVDAKSWLNWFKRYYTFRKQDEGQQLLTLPFYLTSHARIWYEALPDGSKTDLTALKAAFEARFKKQDILDTELLDITQRPEESCNDYFSRVLKKSQQSTADKSLVSSLAIKGLKPAIKQMVMPQNPKDFDDARQRAILAEKTVLATTTPVAAYIHSSANSGKIDELTKMVQDLQVILDNQKSQQQQQQYNPNRREGQRGSWRGRSRKHNRDWRNPPAWQQQSWNQQPAAQYWQQQPAQNQQGPSHSDETNQRPQLNCTGCKGKDLNCNFPAYCSSFKSYCNQCRQRSHYVAACTNSR